MFEVFLTSRAEKQLKTLPSGVQKRVIKAINALERTFFPFDYDVRKLRGMESTYRLRIATYRLLYKVNINEKNIIVLAILPRKSAYKKR